jgi:3-methyladenine DNA glycosylase AlkD
MTLAEVRRGVRRLENSRRADTLRRFFKTGPGEYGAGDRFLGLTVPEVRSLVRRYRGAPREVRKGLVASSFHEERLLGLLLLVDQYRQGGPEEREVLYREYVEAFPRINNWDLVDATAEHVVGAHLASLRASPLAAWAKSENLWIRRISILATFHLIRRGRFRETLRIARILLRDPHDLIHKAVGWMLREVGKRDVRAAEGFLRSHYRSMPRTMLRYAIERFPERKRLAYLRGTV